MNESPSNIEGLLNDILRLSIHNSHISENLDFETYVEAGTKNIYIENYLNTINN